MAASTQRTVRTPDGRTLAVEEAGDPGGRPVLATNGTPNSRHLYGPAADDAAARGLRLDWFDGMGQENADDFRLMTSDPKAARVKLEKDREKTLAASAADLSELLKTLLTPTDEATLTGQFAEYLVYTGREGLAPGSQGWWDDGVAHGGQWGFELSDIRIPVLLMHGRQDQFVPFGHGQWLAARIPGVDARLLDDDGHLTLETNRVGEVHAWLADRL